MLANWSCACARAIDLCPTTPHHFAVRPSFQENGGGGSGSAVVNKRDNPHKYLLYKPTVAQFMVFMASGHRELPANGALLLYISGDGCFSTKTPAEDAA